jgi:uncharacterized membrane protein
MTIRWHGPMKLRMRTYLLSGLLVLVPLWVTYLVVVAVFNAMASVLRPLVARLPWNLPPWGEFALSVAAFVALVLLVGFVTSRVVGRRLLALGDALIMRVPLIKTLYSSVKQIVDAIAVPSKNAFKSVVLIEYPRAGMKSIAFATGVSRGADGGRWCRVFVPTTPNPTSGFLEFVPVEEVLEVEMTIEAAFKMIVSGGVLAPETLVTRPFNPSAA